MKKQLKELITQTRGVSYKATDVTEKSNGIPILRANNIQEEGINLENLIYVSPTKIHDEQYLKKGDIIICTSSGSKNIVGKASAYNKDIKASFGAFCKVVRVNSSSEIHREFIQKYFQSKIYRNSISKLSIGANINNIKSEHIGNLEINVPPLPEQKKIAAHLDSIQNAIDSKKKQLDCLDELVKSKFTEMFGENPAESGKWKVEKIENLGTLKNGMNFSPFEKGYTLNCLNVSDFKDNYKILDCTVLNKVDLNSEPPEDYFLKNEDIVFVRSNGNKNLVGRCVAVYPYNSKTVYSGFCIRFRKESKELSTDFILHFLKTEKTREKIQGKGASIQNLTQQILNSVKVPIPPLALQVQFASYVQKIDSAKDIVKSQLKDLRELLDSNMNSYFGE